MKTLPAYVLAAVLSLLLACCVNPKPTLTSDNSSSRAPAPWDLVEEGESPPPSKKADTIVLPEPEEDYDLPEDSVSISSALPDSVPVADLSNYRGIGRLDELFNDSNKYQYAAGERIGITPIVNIAQSYFTRRPLVRIESNDLFVIDRLTHSMPYLVPEAADLLRTIGKNFRDSLASKKMGSHRFRITSLLRSAHSVKKLKRVNRNATDSSTHQLATTFDISYAKFDIDGSKPVSDEELKYVLAEVLRDLRRNGRCLVKYEKKSPCFHITATGR